MPDTFILIPGRTSRQGTSLNVGKDSDEYLDETSTVQMAPEDMERIGLSSGDRVRITSEHGSAELRCRTARKDELQAGVLFMSYGPLSSQLMGGDTHGTGMPDSKAFDVSVEKIR